MGLEAGAVGSQMMTTWKKFFRMLRSIPGNVGLQHKGQRLD
jgi:hypothetical protein